METVRKVIKTVKIINNYELTQMIINEIYFSFSFIISKRCHGIGHFCGDNLYLIGGRTKHRLENTLVEQFTLDIGKLYNLIHL